MRCLDVCLRVQTRDVDFLERVILAKMLVNNSYKPKAVEAKDAQQGCIFDIQRYSINDGPGIRTTVFFKGCPLRCLWCDNPESQKQSPQLLYFEPLCTHCYRCVEVCPHEATSVDSNGAININRELCQICGHCIQFINRFLIRDYPFSAPYFFFPFSGSIGK